FFCLYFVSQKPRNNGAKGLYSEIKEKVSKLGINRWNFEDFYDVEKRLKNKNEFGGNPKHFD
ncbi:hypothetical protein AKJ62_03465, partial [candidate division MSBL1 archaeon SCGC-AAA259D14]